MKVGLRPPRRSARRGSAGEKPFELTVDSIVRGPELVGYEPESPRWSGEGKRIYFEWEQRTDPVHLQPEARRAPDAVHLAGWALHVDLSRVRFRMGE